MSFKPEIVEKAMLACGRHCCLCHKFCGTKIETHHIKQRADGGDDSYENCIPLCFDCHAEVGSYNPRHPKGRKFSESELISHRDKWYKKVEIGGVTFDDEKHMQVDRELFSVIRKILKSDRVIHFLRQTDLAGPFRFEEIDPIHEYWRMAELPESEFLNPTLEGLRAQLNTAIQDLVEYYPHVIFPMEKNSNLGEIPREWGYPSYKGDVTFSVAQKRLGELADDTCKAYDELIRQGRRILSVV